MEEQPKIIESHIISDQLKPARLSDYAVGVFSALPTKKSVKKAILAGRMRVEGEIKTTGWWVVAGRTIELLEDRSHTVKTFPRKLEVVYEDDFLAVINKPTGLPVSGNFFKTVANTLSFNLKKSEAGDALTRAVPMHRLDGLTSGLLLVAKSKKAQLGLAQQFENQQIEKKYQAIAMGELPSEGKVDFAIDGKQALTHFQLKKIIPSLQSGHLSLVDLFPTTGRTHQLRIHLAHLNCPILGDALYGKSGHILKGKGLFLSAVGLKFLHPVTEKNMVIEIPTPNKFQRRMKLEEERWTKFKTNTSVDI